MSNLKRHFATGTVTTACGRGKIAISTPSRVTCLNCKATPDFNRAKYEADVAAKIAFDAQEPRSYREPWKDGVRIFCPNCGGDQFRDAGRSCHGHYQDYVCAGCGEKTSRLTETGMSF